MGGRLVRPQYCRDSEFCSRMEALSDELLVEIITRLNDDIKCTFRCKCVCKRWLGLINPNPLSPKFDPYFVGRYLSRRTDPAPMFCLLTNNVGGVGDSSLSLIFLGSECPDPHILSSANGLILCCPGPYDHSAYFICNPVTKQWLSLPPPPLCSERARSGGGRVLAGFAIDGDQERFRVVCVPSRNESSEMAVEVFSSETRLWDNRVVERASAALSRPSCFQRIAVCNGIAYWIECSVFTAFNLWDSSFRFFPAPCTSKAPYIRFAGQCQGLFRVVTCIHLYNVDGPTYEVYVLRDSDEWFLEHVIRPKRLTSTSNWLSEHQQTLVFLAFHPHNDDILYMRCRYLIVECDVKSGQRREIAKLEGDSITADPLMLPWWPTPLPRLMNHGIKARGAPLVNRVMEIPDNTP